MSSFYGGPRGQSFEIVKYYPNIDSMKADFVDNTCTVYYGQYVSIISTDEHNGEIYKRTSLLSNGDNGAKLVGQISGPAGKDSQIVFLPYSDPATDGATEHTIDLFVAVDEPTGNPKQKGWYIKQDNHYIKTEDETVQSGTTYYQFTENVISGEGINSIPYKTKTNVDAAQNLIETIIASKIPYQTIEIDTNVNVSQVGGNITISQTVDEPLYKKYQFTVPSVISGNSIEELKFIDTDTFAEFIDEGTLIYKAIGSSEVVTAQEIANQSIIAYKLKEYSTNNPSTEKWYKLCDFSDIDIQYNSINHTIIIKKDDDENHDQIVPIRDIQSMRFDSATGKLYATYTLNGVSEEVRINDDNNLLRWITNITATDEGFRIIYNVGEPEFFVTPVFSIKEVTLLPNGNLKVVYTKKVYLYEQKDSQVLSDYEIKESYLNQLDTTDITNDEEYGIAIENFVEANKFKEDLFVLTEDESVQQININGIQVYKRYFERTNEQANIEEIAGIIKSIESLSYNPTTQIMTVSYNTGYSQELSVPVKGIEGMRVNDNWLQVLYTGDETYTNLYEMPQAPASINDFILEQNGRLGIVLTDDTTKWSNTNLVYPELIFVDDNQRLKYVTNTGATYVEVTEPIVNPKVSELYEKDGGVYILTADEEPVQDKKYYELVVNERYVKTLLSDPINSIIKTTIASFTYDNVDYYNTLLVQYSSPEKNTVIYNDESWAVVGEVAGSNSGICIDLYINPSDAEGNYSTIDNTIVTLNSQYEHGYNDNPTSCIAVGGTHFSKRVYSFDKTAGTWRFLGSCFSAPENTIAVNSSEIADNVANLPEGGIWMITEERETDYDESVEFFGTRWEYFGGYAPTNGSSGG